MRRNGAGAERESPGRIPRHFSGAFAKNVDANFSGTSETSGAQSAKRHKNVKTAQNIGSGNVRAVSGRSVVQIIVFRAESTTRLKAGCRNIVLIARRRSCDKTSDATGGTI